MNVLVNPFGTIFNPLSLSLLLQVASGKSYDFEQNLVQQNGIWYAYDLHSSLSSPEKSTLLQTITERMQQTKQQLQQASLLIITMGTAIGYRLQESGKVVANCHKLPAKNFERLLLNADELENAFGEMYKSLKGINPQLQLLLTVSPVRHLKETVEMNSVSKATLRVLCHQLQKAHPDVLYFPAYEIMMDDLRDYRFYKEDMLHPTPQAEEYIWQKFVDAYYAPAFRQFMKQWAKMQNAIAHRPFHPESEAHQAFLNNTLKQLQELEQKYAIDVTREKAAITQQLKV
ncbi:MAG: GSCFA domain-containing protein [Pontibacter sp.]|nr:GSCFA domain-containing protein [Pontibacter sp.]